MTSIREQEINRVRSMTGAALLTSIVFLMTFTPIGFINLIVIKATIVHIPVILGSLVLGPKVGALLGFMFGLASFINNTMNPSSLLSFAFSPLVPIPGTDAGSIYSLIICFVPRILVGIVPYYVDRAVMRITGGGRMRFVSLFAAGVAGGMTNTLLVMHFIYIIFKDAYALKTGIAADAVYGVILSIITFHGIPESLVAGLFASAVGKPIITRFSARSE